MSLVAEIYIPKKYISNNKLNPNNFRSHFVDGYFVYPDLAWEYCLNKYKNTKLPKAIDIENNSLTTLVYIDKKKELSIREKDLIMFYPNVIPAEEKMSLLLDSNLDLYTFAYDGGCVSPAEISFLKNLEEKYYNKLKITDNKIKLNLFTIFLNEMKYNFDSSNIPANYLETINKLESLVNSKVDLHEVEVIIKGEDHIIELTSFFRKKYPNSFVQTGKIINFPNSIVKQTKPYHRKMNMRH